MAGDSSASQHLLLKWKGVHETGSTPELDQTGYLPKNPRPSTKSPERKREQKKRWFRNGQKWRTGCEGHISVVKRRHGLGRSRYKGDAGIKRWVGLGVIADNLVNISRVMAKRPSG
jgi:hypothetical protein